MAMDINPWADYGNLDAMQDDSLAEAGGKFVKFVDGVLAVNTDAGTESFGVLRDDCLQYCAPAVRTHYMTYVTPADGYTAEIGDLVTNDADGNAVEATTGNIVEGEVVEVYSDEIRIKLHLDKRTVA